MPLSKSPIPVPAPIAMGGGSDASANHDLHGPFREGTITLPGTPVRSGWLRTESQGLPGTDSGEATDEGPTRWRRDVHACRHANRRAIAVIKELGLHGQLGIRLDSGDLGELARRGRRILDRAGLSHVRILASGGLDEFQIDDLVRGGAPIDAFGVGTKMGVSTDHPYLRFALSDPKPGWPRTAPSAKSAAQV